MYVETKHGIYTNLYWYFEALIFFTYQKTKSCRKIWFVQIIATTFLFSATSTCCNYSIIKLYVMALAAVGYFLFVLCNGKKKLVEVFCSVLSHTVYCVATITAGN